MTINPKRVKTIVGTKDSQGVELNVGDVVAYIESGYPTIKVGEIMRLTPKGATIFRGKLNDGRPYGANRPSNRMIKLKQEDYLYIKDENTLTN